MGRVSRCVRVEKLLAAAISSSITPPRRESSQQAVASRARGVMEGDFDFPGDLADVPGVSNDVLQRLDGDVLRSLALSQEQVEKFNRDGFVATEQPVFAGSDLDWLRTALDRLTCQDPPHPAVDLLHELHYNEAAGSGQVLFHCLGHWRLEPSFHHLVHDVQIGLPACQLLQGRSVRFWHDQAFVKPGGDGACVQWHQVCVPRLPRALCPS
jgi:hypothetical protein